MRTIRVVEVVLIGAALAAAAPLAAQAQAPAQKPAQTAAQSPAPMPAQPAITGVAATGPGKAAAAASAEVTATVVAVDADHRSVTLKRADGEVSTIDVGEQVKNFNQIKVGDTVRAKYTRAVALELKKGAAPQGPPTEETAMTPAPAKGAKPGGTIARKVTAVADVVAVDTAKQLVTLRGPGGNEVELNVQDPNQLKNVQKGDHVLVTYVEALAISVEPKIHSAAAK